MEKLKYIFPLLGLALIGLWFVKVTANFEGGSIQSLSEAMSRNQYLAFVGFGCFWVVPTFNRIRSGSKFNFSEMADALKNTLKDDIYPTFGRQMPIWVHALRFIGFGSFIYFLSKGIKIQNDQLFFNWSNFFPAVFGASIFFLLPFLFKRKTR